MNMGLRMLYRMYHGRGIRGWRFERTWLMFAIGVLLHRIGLEWLTAANAALQEIIRTHSR